MGSKILKNAAWGFVGELVSRVAKAAQLFLIVRLLGPQEFGRFNSALAVAGLFGVFFDFGISTIALREVARGDRTAFRAFAFLKAGVSTIGLLCVVCWSFLGSKENGAGILLVVAAALYLIGSDIPTFVAVSYRARGEFWRETLWRGVLAASQLILCVALLLIKVSTEILVVGLFASTLIAFIPFFVEWGHHVGGPPSLRIHLHSVIECLPIAGSVLVGSIYMNWDVVMLSKYATLDEVGWYSVAVKTVFGLFIMPLHFFSLSTLPVLARQSADGDSSEWKKRWLHAFIMSTAAGALFTLIVSVFSGQLVDLMFGQSVESAGPVLMAYVISGFFFYLYTPLSQRLLIEGRQRLTLSIQVSAALFNLTAVWYLVPKFGVWGAVLSCGLTHAFIASGLFLIIMSRESNDVIRREWHPLCRIGLFLVVSLLLAGLQRWYWSVGAFAVLCVGLHPELRRLIGDGYALFRSVTQFRSSRN